MRVCHTPKIPKVDVAAVAWTSASPYTDRRVWFSTTRTESLRRWLAWHWVVGVRYFLIFESGATWTNPHHSKLWPAIKPFAEANAASLVPWGTDAAEDPTSRSRPGKGAGIGADGLFGRPSQYAAQNSGLYRLREFVKWIAFLDGDEMLLPNATSVGDGWPRLAGAAVAVPHGSTGGAPRLTKERAPARPCPLRNKLVVNEKAADVWDHTLILPPRASRGIRRVEAAPRALESGLRVRRVRRGALRHAGVESRGARLCGQCAALYRGAVPGFCKMRGRATSAGAGI